MDTLATLSVMERIVFLRRVPLFADLDTGDLERVARIASERLFADGEQIAEQGEIGGEVFIIVTGAIRVSARGEDGQEHELAVRQPGEAVGEMSVISKTPRIASMTAVGDVRTLTVEQAPFEGILRERPDTALAVMRELCARLKE
jgi:CRP/FNR family transcriptional regulator, cyclic AMP receptor protein